jgi:hypothetical protein
MTKNHLDVAGFHFHLLEVYQTEELAGSNCRDKKRTIK